MWICGLMLAGTVQAQEVGRARPQGGPAADGCVWGQATADLDVNNVRARLYNNGHLFWGGSGNVYTVPKNGQANAIFSSSIWVGGLVDGELRFAGTVYGPFEFWPGPLGAAGKPPADCAPYDHIYKVSLHDVRAYEATGVATEDLRHWPWQLGAPVEDGDGNPDNYDLAGGDRPEILGHQTLWWVMNDAAGPKQWSKTGPMNLEVQVTAFAFAADTDAALDNTTFYRYKLIYKGEHPLEEAYFGIHSDVDLGDAVSDYVGSDTVRGIGYVYNGTDVDPGTDGYGDRPPALGYDFVQGPLVTSNGVDDDRDGVADEEDERLQMTTFLFYNSDQSEQGSPHGASDDPYQYLQGLWRNGTPMTYGATGYGGDTPTNYMFPGDPVTGAYWSEENIDGRGKANTPANRLFLMSTGPFTMHPGDVQEIVVSIVWARGQDRLDSVTRMREAADRVQAVFQSGAAVPLPEAPVHAPLLVAPVRDAAGQPRNLTLSWEPLAGVAAYEVQVARDAAWRREVGSWKTYAPVTLTLDETATYYWRVRAVNAGGYGPWSEVRRFTTSARLLAEGGVLVLGNSEMFVEHAGPGDDYACGPEAGSTFGCDLVGGNLVYGSYNGSGEYIMYYNGGAGPEAVIGGYAPNDFEIRFTEAGSYAQWAFQDPYNIAWVPFEVWDIGPTGPFGENDPGDDVQLVPALFADGGADGTCAFAAGEAEGQFSGLETWTITDRVYAYYPVGDDYAAWEAAAKALVDADPDGCAPTTAASDALIDYDRHHPLQRLVFNMNPAAARPYPAEGVVLRFYTTDFSSMPPAPAAPRDSADVPAHVPARLSWYLPPGTAHTRLQVATDPGFRDLLVDAAELPGTSFPLAELTPGTTYYWRARAINTRQGLASDWSPVWRFTAREAVFEAVLSGVNQHPANVSPARGHVQATLEEGRLTLHGAFEGLAGPLAAQGAALFIGAPGAEGTKLFTLRTQTAAERRRGSFAASPNTFDLQARLYPPGLDAAAVAEAVRQGRAYVALRSAAYPAGELRGQLLPMPNHAPAGETPLSTARRIELTQDPSTPVTLTWAASTDPDGQAVRYRWQLAAEDAFNTVLASVDVGEGTRYETTVGAITTMLEGAGVDLRAGARLYHRIASTDGSMATGGPVLLLELLRQGGVAVEEGAGLPATFTLEANYPNPFNPQTTIRFGLPQEAAVRLAVYDVVGRRVAVLHDGQVLPAGWHRVAFDGGRLASGVYFYRIEAGGFTQTRPMILMK